MSIRESQPIYNRRHPLPADLCAKLAVLVRTRGVLGTSRLVRASTNVVEELASGGGVTAACRDRVATVLANLEVAS